MNHIISLPLKNIENIIREHKELLVLKKYPGTFNHKKDVLLLEDEETGLIYGTLRVAGTFWSNNILKLVIKFWKSIAYIDGNFLTYLHNKKGFYVFQIYSYQLYK